MEIKQLVVSYKPVEFKEEGDCYSFKGYASTFGNEDLGGDVVLPGAFKASLAKRMPKQLYQHDKTQPVGVFKACQEDNKGLFVDGILPKSVTLSKDLAELIKIGAIDAMSIGYSLPSADSYEFKDGVRYLKQIDLWEISWVTFPMNPEAKVIDIKSVIPFQDLPLAPKDRAWDSAIADSRVRSWAGATDAPNEKYRKAFLWCDSAAPELFGSYKLQIGDVINGELQAIPRAIFAVAGVLRGARGGVNIPGEDKERIKGHINRYYKSLDMESPFNKSLAVDEIEDIRDVNEFLKQWGFTNTERNVLVSKIKQISRRENEKTDSSRRDGGAEVQPELAEELRRFSKNVSKN